jgi:hypothetical protein
MDKEVEAKVFLWHLWGHTIVRAGSMVVTHSFIGGLSDMLNVCLDSDWLKHTSPPAHD